MRKNCAIDRLVTGTKRMVRLICAKPRMTLGVKKPWALPSRCSTHTSPARDNPNSFIITFVPNSPFFVSLIITFP